MNRPLLDRRCTLNCQGCHVNPNGGGLRSRYGAWNQQRWLKSFRVEFLNPNQTPLPASQQLYVGGEGRGTAKRAATAVTDVPVADESRYDKFHDTHWRQMSKSKSEFLEQIAVDDPYHQERSQLLQAGGDFRHLLLSRGGDSYPSGRKFNHWLMTVDFGVRVRPIPEKLSLVMEARFLNQPDNSNLLKAFTTEGRIRSAYLLSDDLPLNSYVMYGLFRPMFGFYDPDHDALSQVYSGLLARGVFHAVSFGLAPNIPFLSASAIFPNPNTAFDQSKGFTLSLGGRWITLGASAMVSYWSTSAENSAGTSLKKEMISFSGGLNLGRLIWNAEVLGVRKEFAAGRWDTASVVTNQFRYRAWRENYLVVNHAVGNAARNLKAGSSTEMGLGIRSFPISGIEAELLYVARSDTASGVSTRNNEIQFQTHVYF